MTIIGPTTLYCDESRLQSSFPVVAGFWNNTDVWLECEKKINEALTDKPPGLEAKKYTRDNPVKFATVLRATNPLPIFATIENSFYSDFWELKGDGDRLWSTAYAQCSFACCEMLDSYAIREGYKQSILVVFDDDVKSPQQLWMKRGYVKYYSQKERSLLRREPLFENDKITLPLLVSDLYAWLLSRLYNKEASREQKELDALGIIHEINPLHVEITKHRFFQDSGLDEEGEIDINGDMVGP